MISKRDMLLYKHMSAEQQRTFDRWLKGSIVVGSIFATAIVAMAIIQSNLIAPRQAAARMSKAMEAGVSEQHQARGGGTAYQLLF